MVFYDVIQEMRKVCLILFHQFHRHPVQINEVRPNSNVRPLNNNIQQSVYRKPRDRSLVTIHRIMNTSSILDEMSLVGNDTNDTDVMTMEDFSVSIRYTVFVPIFIAACLVTFLMNAVIIVAYPLVRNLSRVRFILIIISL